jgi:hypothetical protein
MVGILESRFDEACQVESSRPIKVKAGPTWATWKYSDTHLPRAFHEDPTYFEDVVEWLKTPPYCSPSQQLYTIQEGFIIALAVGLIMRDLTTIQFCDDDDELPRRLANSTLTFSHHEILSQQCVTLVDGIKSCLNEGTDSSESQSNSVPAPSNTRQPSPPHEPASSNTPQPPPPSKPPSSNGEQPPPDLKPALKKPRAKVVKPTSESNPLSKPMTRSRAKQ